MTVDSIEKVALLVVGWLLGLLGPTIIEAIKRHRENKQVKVALAAELREVSYKLVMANHLIHLHFGTVDRLHLRWFKASTQPVGWASFICPTSVMILTPMLGKR
jgi:hypothetical protein